MTKYQMINSIENQKLLPGEYGMYIICFFHCCCEHHICHRVSQRMQTFLCGGAACAQFGNK